MANSNTPFGLKPIGHIMGLPWNGALRECNVAALYGTAIFIQDPVLFAGSSDATGFRQTIARATVGDGNFISGVVVGFAPDGADTSSLYWVASTAITRNAFVCVDPYVVFEIQACSGVILANTVVGLNAVLIATNAGNAFTGISGIEMDSGASDAPAADASNQLLILGAVPREDNDISAVNAKWHVLINLHSLLSTGAGTGALGV